jgi:hypothetical protein
MSILDKVFMVRTIFFAATLQGFKLVILTTADGTFFCRRLVENDTIITLRRAILNSHIETDTSTFMATLESHSRAFQQLSSLWGCQVAPVGIKGCQVAPG